MRISFRLVKNTISVIALAGILGTGSIAIAEEKEKGSSALEEGKKLAFDRKKGNCLACHMIEGGEMAGTIGPPLISMKARFDKDALKSQISDARAKNPNTIMPPFAAHSIMSDKEIDKVVEFIHSL